MRLQRYIALSGVTSRRKAEKLIEDGRIEVNGHIVREMGTRVDAKNDVVKFDGDIIEPEEEDIYILLNKPLGYVTTMDDEFDRPIVMDLVREIEERIYPVGRLDIDTTGLLLLTNDGKVTNKLTHPRYEIEKTYRVLVDGVPTKDEIHRFETGLRLDDGMTAPARLSLIQDKGNESLIDIIIHEGRNRQVRRMCSAIGHEVKDLKRISIGEINLGRLKEGKWRHLNKREVDYLNSL